MSRKTPRDKSQSEEQGYSDILELVEQLAAIVERAQLTEVRIRDNELEVQVSRQKIIAAPISHSESGNAGTGQAGIQETVTSSSVPGTGRAGIHEEDTQFINAPMPSRFYRAPAPDEPPFVQEGDTVSTGDPVAVLEVMKTYNPVEAPFSCEILEILAEDGEAVEYAQPLFRVRQN